MIAPEAWQAFAGIAGILILLGGVAMALQRLGIMGGGGRAAGARCPDMRDRFEELQRAFNDHRLCVAEHYVRRDDWVPMTSRVIGLLEDHTRMLARLDERTRAARREAEGDG